MSCVCRHAVTNPDGLDDEEVFRRRTLYGLNSITETVKAGFFAKLWEQINNVLIWILVASAIISAALQVWADLALILAVIILNVAIGMAQEAKAEKASQAIKAMLSSNAMAVRSGERRTLPAADLVPGDVLFLQPGDRVPADARLVSVFNLQVRTGKRVCGRDTTLRWDCDTAVVTPFSSPHSVNCPRCFN